MAGLSNIRPESEDVSNRRLCDVVISHFNGKMSVMGFSRIYSGR